MFDEIAKYIHPNTVCLVPSLFGLPSYKFTVRPLLGGQGLKSWGYDALNPLKEMPCSDRRFMAITKLQLMGFLGQLGIT